ncbi:SIR2 family NAD-dependent protein deacylase [Propioniciclava soli]|uniref:SIR2 family NAD-dependent protein deacylase n=1 Tax=Propioniciclava soli TaxID=2775081 RepID=UPI001E3A68C0|nr:Sir2 family NAD-dependent protein deacetylase [Propioniciclava soli]
MTDQQFEQARALVAGASAVLALTGAGLSTASGIPDFRGPRGRWTLDPDAERISTLSWYRRDVEIRRRAWQIRATSPARTAQPNPGHHALVTLERQHRLAGIVTQNTDGLHLAAGSSPELVHEIHGNARSWRCEGCDATGPLAEMLALVEAGDPDPRCPRCGGITRATVVLFGEMLDPAVLDAAVALAERCDLVLAVGTSLQVHPVAGLVPHAVGRGALLVIVNAEPTPYDPQADAVVRHRIEEALPALVA